jgi:hypothetical protein
VTQVQLEVMKVESNVIKTLEISVNIATDVDNE